MMAKYQSIFVAGMLLLTQGCQDSQTPDARATSPQNVQPVSSPTTADGTLTDVETPAKTAESGKPEPDGEAVPDFEHPFEPPFGHRVDLFRPVEDADQAKPSRPGNAEQADAPEVALKGFANVGEPRAVLVIGEDVVPLAAGQEKHGITVISIEPPQATLQRGRRRWTVSLIKRNLE